ncbi:MAG: hypothetical protein H0U64_06335 [Gemmatimonadaceae bacterium]|nr:hypothetical protein [Gemmatimonadaceae bacterium]
MVRRTTCWDSRRNIIIGHLIPAGTGMYRYSDVEIEDASVPPPLPELPPEPTLAEIVAAGDSFDMETPAPAGPVEEL